MDEDVLTAWASGVMAAGFAFLAMRAFMHRRVILGLGAGLLALALGFVCWFFATFTIRMF
jgi:hypothetical protein